MCGGGGGVECVRVCVCVGGGILLLQVQVAFNTLCRPGTTIPARLRFLWADVTWWQEANI